MGIFASRNKIIIPETINIQRQSSFVSSEKNNDNNDDVFYNNFIKDDDIILTMCDDNKINSRINTMKSLYFEKLPCDTSEKIYSGHYDFGGYIIYEYVLDKKGSVSYVKIFENYICDDLNILSNNKIKTDEIIYNCGKKLIN